MSYRRVNTLLLTPILLLFLLCANAFCADPTVVLSENTLTFSKTSTKQQVNIANKSANTLFWSTKSPVTWLKAAPNLGRIDSPTRMHPGAQYLHYNFWPKPANPWRFNYPLCTGVDNEGSIYILDSRQSRAVKFDKNENFLFEITSLVAPEHIVFDSLNNAYILDCGKILKFDKSGRPLAYMPNNTFPSVGFAEDIAIDSKNNVYVADYYSSVAKFDKNGKFLIKWGSAGLKNGQFTPAKTSYKGCSLSIVTDSRDYVYVADNHYSRIQKFDANGKFIKAWPVWGAKLPTIAVWDAQWGASFFINKSKGAIYIGDEHSNGLYIFDTNGKGTGYISYPRSSNNYYLGDGAVNAAGTVYFCPDSLDNYIYKRPSGGTWSVAGGLNTLVDRPSAIVADKKGNLWVANRTDSINIFSPNGQLIKKVPVGYSYIDAYLTVDAANNIYCVELGDFTKFDANGKVLATRDTYDLLGVKAIAANSKGIIYCIGNYGSQIWRLNQKGEIIDKTDISKIIKDKYVSSASTIVIDAQDNIYIANYSDGIYKFDQNYTVSQKWAWASGTGVGSTYQSVSICLDASNNIYAAFPESGQVHKYGPYSNPLQVWGERGWMAGKLMAPTGVAVANNCVYVTDKDNCRVQVYSQAVNTVEVSVDYAKLPFFRKKPTAVTLTFTDDSSAAKPVTNLNILVN